MSRAGAKLKTTLYIYTGDTDDDAGGPPINSTSDCRTSNSILQRLDFQALIGLDCR